MHAQSSQDQIETSTSPLRLPYALLCNHEPASRPHGPSARLDGGTIALELTATRAAIGLAVATAIAFAARRADTLSQSGLVAATAMGAAAVAAGWSWGFMLLSYFVSSVALTRFRSPAKVARTGSVVAKGGPRDALQVLANGGVFALASVLWIVSPAEAWRGLGAGALAGAASDTWATEIGTLARRVPRSIVSWRRVPTGSSGGVSPPGLAAAIAGAAFVAVVALAFDWPGRTAGAAWAGGIVGSTLDSLLGATLQVRRRCDRCNAATERTRHTCGEATRVVGGLPWFDNDAVNALSTAAAGVLALLLAG